MARVSVARSFSIFTEGRTDHTVPGATVSEVLHNLGELFPAIKSKLLLGDGQISKRFLLSLDEDVVRYEAYTSTPVGEDSRIRVIALLGGG